jgi:transposase
MNGTPKYPAELRERAIRMVQEHRGDYASEWAAIGSIAAKLRIAAPETLRTWIRRAEVDGGQRPGVTGAERERLRRAHAASRDERPEAPQQVVPGCDPGVLGREGLRLPQGHPARARPLPARAAPARGAPGPHGLGEQRLATRVAAGDQLAEELGRVGAARLPPVLQVGTWGASVGQVSPPGAGGLPVTG